MDSIGLWQIANDGPSRLSPAPPDREKQLADWIERDPALLERGLVIVARQLRLDGGPLDLLALDPQGRWVLIEIKRERLRREVIAQAIDYASCLHTLDSTALRDHCDAYLASRGRIDTLDSLLADRGRSLDDHEDGREIVIYLVGTGYDVGLERMVDFLANRAELAIRMVKFSAYRDAQGHWLLAREIHESVIESSAAVQKPTRSAPSAEAVLALAEQNGVGGAVHHFYDTAIALGLHVRPFAKSLMIAPPANRTRCLFVVWVERRHREPGIAKAFISADSFEQFYGISEADLVAGVGQVGYVFVDQTAAETLCVAIQKLLGAGANGPFVDGAPQLVPGVGLRF